MGSDELTEQEKISLVYASASILGHLRAAWNARFGEQGSEFDAQDITITVPASFDAVAQRLTLAAARQAGFPDHVRLLEEPQAAFYRWLEQQAGCSDPSIRGGTSDFSDPVIKRVAVSDHILLGGDNIDLAIAHLLEPRFAVGWADFQVGSGTTGSPDAGLSRKGC